jgi:adenylate kinase
LKTKIIFLGPPGSGKGTYSSYVSWLLDIPHISTGQIFREAIKQNTDLGKTVNEYLQKGVLVPDEVTIRVLKERMSKPDCQKGFILDGYPRTMPQAKSLDEAVDIDVVINLKIHETILIKKLSARRICEKCGDIYNIADIYETVEGVQYDMPSMLPKTPGTCDKCGGKLIQRKDDRVEVIKTRLRLDRERSEPLIRYYRERGLVEDVSVHLGLEKTMPIIIDKVKAHRVGD